MATAETLLKQFNNIKTLPHIAIRLSKMISDDTCTMEEFEEVIRLDPTLVVRLLRLVNSAYYSLRFKVKTISESIVFIGVDSLRNMVVVEALKGIFKLSKNEEIFSKKRLWLHCATVSICSQMIAERLFGLNSENVFLCGILHDIGMIVENQVVPELFCQTCKIYEPGLAPITQYETEIIGTNHCAIGCLLAQEWKLSSEVQKGIREHHKNLDPVDPSSIAGILQIAEYLVARLDYTALPGMQVRLSASLTDHVRSKIDEYRTLSVDLPGEIQKAREIYDLDLE
ncbi:MAG: HDOD domain-containing protein [Desulfobacteraceae bacterium]|nr:HDOD domain-containing protein [Desulfobacteraceae bacterium]